jgi:outer membrane protein OmpA-like peptidoglycan-associated protein
VKLHYRIEEGRLVAENGVVLDKLTLGDRVEGPDVTSLPVALAVALLKDGQGRIDLDLPVRGDLDDPKFSYGKVLGKALLDLIRKTVASPFSVIGALASFDADELRSVEFAPGSAEVEAEQGKKLDAIGQALRERPALRLEVTGGADTAFDRAALAHLELTKELKRARRAELKAKGGSVPKKLSQIELSDADYDRLFDARYRSRFGTRAPRDAAGGFTAAAKDALAGSVTVDDDALRRLAQKRAAAVQDRLAGAGVEAERVFAVEVDVDATVEAGRVVTALSLTS